MRSRYRLERISRLEQVLIQKFGEKAPFTFMQVGANDGISFDNLFQIVTSRNCSGIVVEPIPCYYKQLEALYSSFENIIPVNLGVHQSENSMEMYRVDRALAPDLPHWVTGIASLNPSHFKQFDVPEEAVVVEEVQLIHLMQLIENYQLDHLDLLQIDCEGYDAQVISMISFNKIRPLIIKFEHAHIKDSDLQATRRALEAQGYELRKDGYNTIAIAQ